MTDTARSPWLVSRSARLAGLVSLCGGVALGVAASGRELFPGERSVLVWFVDAEPRLGAPARLLDDAFTDASATLVYAVLLALVWRFWGTQAAAAFGLAGGFTILARIGNLVDRPRPTGRLEWGSADMATGGFPSGHVVYFVLVFGTLAFLATQRSMPRRAMVIVGVSGILIAFVGPSRLVLADHWPADVVGGYLLAQAGLVVVALFWQWWGPARGAR